MLSHFQGVLVEEVDEGQPCLACHEKCSGFAPHLWRWVPVFLRDSLFRLGFWTDHRSNVW